MIFVIPLKRNEDGIWVVECPSIPGCISRGESREETEEYLREAIVGCLEVRSEQGMPLTVETRTI